MVVPQATITLILNPSMRQRMMRLPVLRETKLDIHKRPLDSQKRCPVKRGGTYTLKSSARADTQATITVIDVRKEKLAALTLQDARREGFASIQGSLEAWSKTYWSPSPEQMVWVIAFARDGEGDTAALLREEKPVFLARSGDYTLHKSQAIKGEAEVLMPLAADLAKARRIAVQKRTDPQKELLARMKGDLTTLKQDLKAMKDRSRAKLIEKELGKLTTQLLGEDHDLQKIALTTTGESATLSSVGTCRDQIGAESNGHLDHNGADLASPTAA